MLIVDESAVEVPSFLQLFAFFLEFCSPYEKKIGFGFVVVVVVVVVMVFVQV